MVTQEDFKAVADIMYCQQKDLISNAAGCAVGENLKQVARNLADYFATQNPRFGRERFLKACGLTEEPDDDNYDIASI